jgi:hypothetical protein
LLCDPSRSEPSPRHVVGHLGHVTGPVDGTGVGDLVVLDDFHFHHVNPITVQMAVGRTTPMAMRSSALNEMVFVVHSVSPNWLYISSIPSRVHACTALVVSNAMAVEDVPSSGTSVAAR